MSEILEFIDPTKQPTSVRFTKDECEFINENYERIMGNTERVPIREFFFHAVQKAVSMVSPKVPSVARPEDAKLIAELKAKISSLETRLSEAVTDNESKAAAIDEIVHKNVELEGALQRLEDEHTVTVRELHEMEAAESARNDASQFEDMLILEDMQPVETAIVMEYARLMKTTPKVVLIEKLFLPTVWHGPGDYIPRMNSEAKRKIREAFK